jgi:hypothetical protein
MMTAALNAQPAVVTYYTDISVVSTPRQLTHGTAVHGSSPLVDACACERFVPAAPHGLCCQLDPLVQVELHS